MIKQLKFLAGFFSRLSKREKSVFYAAVFFVALVIVDRALVYPVISKIRSLDKEIEDRELEIKKTRRVLAQKERIISERSRYVNYLSKPKSEDEEVTAILKEIEKIAADTSVYLVDMKPAGVKASGETVRYNVNVNFEGQMQHVVDFMYDIENSTKMLKIERFEITPKSRESSVAKCNLAIAKMIIP
jgi:Tfp pilus assembly protein PilO